MQDQLTVFEILIPRTDDRTGLVHPPALFDVWVIETAERFGGITQLGANLLGFWFDSADLVKDHSHWYRVAVKQSDIESLRTHVQKAAKRFGQRSLYFQRSGEAEFLWATPPK